MRTRTLRTLCPAILTAITLAGCNSPSRVDGARVYPEALPRAEAMPVQLRIYDRSVALTNTTPGVIGPGRLWLNGWFGQQIEAIAPGETRTLPLGGFRDLYGEGLRQGGFFASRRPDRVVLAEIERDGILTPLIVVSQRDEAR